jgi:hypothetical protein
MWMSLFENDFIFKKPLKTLKINFEHFLYFLEKKSLPILAKIETHLSGEITDFRPHKPLYYLYTHCGAQLPPKICSGRHNY